MDRPLQVIGAGHQDVPAERWAALVAGVGDGRGVLADLRALSPDLGAVLLATCNRVELVCVGPEPAVRAAWDRVVGAGSGDAGAAGATPAAGVAGAARAETAGVAGSAGTGGDIRARHRSGPEAVEHLFRVAAGLDSALLGDHEVVGQLRRALDRAHDAGLVAPDLGRVVCQSLRVGRRVRAETGIGAGGAGIGSAVTAAVREAVGDDGVAELVVVGAGAAATTVVRALVGRRLGTVTVVARRSEQARTVARECGAEWAPLDRLGPVLARADVVVVATAAATPVLTVPVLGPARPDLVIDLGVPPQVAPDVAVPVVGLDALAVHEAAHDRRRRAEVPAAEAIVAEELDRWRESQHAAAVDGVVRDLFVDAESLSRAVAAGVAARTGADEEETYAAVRRDVRAFLHQHVTRLRAMAVAGAAS